MNFKDIETLAHSNQRKAYDVISQSQIIPLWEKIGAKVNPVGSLPTGLLMKHRDVDFHIYTDQLNVEESLKVITEICMNPNVTRLEYKNLAKTQECCLEFHVWILDCENNEWQIDMIQIQKGSKFDGYFEHVAERIKAVLTPETRKTILELKYATPEEIKIMGIEYYHAVIKDDVRTWDEFVIWRENNPANGIVEWCP